MGTPTCIKLQLFIFLHQIHYLYSSVFGKNYAPINDTRGGGWAGRGGNFDILSKIFVKNHSPGTTYFVKKHENPHPRAGELCQMFLSRGNAIHSRHPPRPNQTKKCTSLSLRKTDITLPINSTKSNSHKYTINARTRS